MMGAVLLAVALALSALPGVASAGDEKRNGTERILAAFVNFAGYGGGNYVVETAEVIYGELVMEGSTEPGLDVANLAAPWKSVIQKMSDGLCIVTSVATNILYTSDSEVRHRITVSYTLLPKQDEILPKQDELEDYSFLDANVWDDFLVQCALVKCGWSTMDWEFIPETFAEVATEQVKYPTWFSMESTAPKVTTTTLSPYEESKWTVVDPGEDPSDTTGDGSSEGTLVGASLDLRIGQGASYAAMLQPSCDQPEVTQFVFSETDMASFTFCKDVKLITDPLAIMRLGMDCVLADDVFLKAEVELKNPKAKIASDGATLEVDVSHINFEPGLRFRFALVEGAVLGRAGEETSMAFQSPVYSIPELPRKELDVDEDWGEGLFGRLWMRTVLGIVCSCLFCGLFCLLLRWGFKKAVIEYDPSGEAADDAEEGNGDGMVKKESSLRRIRRKLSARMPKRLAIKKGTSEVRPVKATEVERIKHDRAHTNHGDDVKHLHKGRDRDDGVACLDLPGSASPRLISGGKPHTNNVSPRPHLVPPHSERRPSRDSSSSSRSRTNAPPPQPYLAPHHSERRPSKDSSRSSSSRPHSSGPSPRTNHAPHHSERRHSSDSNVRETRMQKMREVAAAKEAVEQRRPPALAPRQA